MSRNFIFSEGEYYHCYSRGVEKRKIFLNKKDHERFLQLLFVCNSSKIIHLSNFQGQPFNRIFDLDKEETLVEIGAYCLMPNHFHLLIREKNKGGISLFMQKLITAYTMYFNRKNERKGSLFESTYKAKHVTGDRYLKYLFSYIHLNPVKIIQKDWKKKGVKSKKEAVKFLENFAYSSYQDYCELDRVQKGILSIENFPEYFSTQENFKDEIFEWLEFGKV